MLPAPATSKALIISLTLLVVFHLQATPQDTAAAQDWFEDTEIDDRTADNSLALPDSQQTATSKHSSQVSNIADLQNEPFYHADNWSECSGAPCGQLGHRTRKTSCRIYLSKSSKYVDLPESSCVYAPVPATHEPCYMDCTSNVSASHDESAAKVNSSTNELPSQLASKLEINPVSLDDETVYDSDVARFVWLHNGWTRCSSTSARRESVVECWDKVAQIWVDYSYCEPFTKPAPNVEHCGDMGRVETGSCVATASDCRPSWTGPWSEAYIDAHVAQDTQMTRESMKRRTSTVKVGGRVEILEGRNIKIKCRLIIRSIRRNNQIRSTIAGQAEWLKDGVEIFTNDSLTVDKYYERDDNSIFSSSDMSYSDLSNQLMADDPHTKRPHNDQKTNLRRSTRSGADFDGKFNFLPQLRGRFSLIRDNTLRIKRLRVDDSGIYTCFHGPISESLILEVKSLRFSQKQ